MQKRAKRKESPSSSTATGGLYALPAPEAATPTLAYTATPESAILELPCAAIVFRDGRRPTTNYINSGL